MENLKFISSTDELDGLPTELGERLNRDLNSHDAACYNPQTNEYVDIECIGLNVTFEAVLLTPEEALLRKNDHAITSSRYKLFADNLKTSTAGQLMLVSTDTAETRELLDIMKSYR